MFLYLEFKHILDNLKINLSQKLFFIHANVSSLTRRGPSRLKCNLQASTFGYILNPSNANPRNQINNHNFLNNSNQYSSNPNSNQSPN